MAIFFELQEKKVGFSRIGRILISERNKSFIQTPNIIIPFNELLIHHLNFIEEFNDHDLFIITEENYLKKEVLREKFKFAKVIYSYRGTIEKFQEILLKNQNAFNNDNIIIIIPFNIPTSTINKDFAQNEIKNFLNIAENILKSNPNLKFGLSIRLFDYFDLFELYFPIIRHNKNIILLNLADCFDNLNKFRQILKILIQIKSEFDNNTVLMASGKIITYLYPILVYLGIDFIDSSYLLYLSSENFYDTIEYLLPIYKVKYLPCSCIACRGNLKNILMEKYSSEKTKFLCLHNLINAKTYMKKVIQYLNYEDFRSFVEKASFNNTNLISMLRILDKQYFNILKFESPITQKNKVINCLGSISYYRPDFQEFRERTIKNFEPESFTSLLILFPCSATKPYSVSKSHKKFLSVLRKFPQFPSFQEIILTSPLGAIPRQLENIYPVNSYNIPVTGDWEEEEIKITSDMLLQLLQKYDKNIPIVAHLEGMYIEIINRVLKGLNHSCYFSEIHNKITSKESLASLENNILKVKDLIKKAELHSTEINFSKTWIRKIIKILDYQFGIGSGLKILSKETKIEIKKDPEAINLIDLKTNERLGTFIKPNGQVMLTIKGAQLLKSYGDLNTNVIVFNGKKINGSTLFRPGVLQYSSDLIPGSNIVILDQERRDVIGVGNLLVGANFIKNSTTGRIAKIYEHI